MSSIPLMLILAYLCITVHSITSCPRQEDITPCTCKPNVWKEVEITCSGLDNEQDLTNAARSVEKIFIFTIDKSSFNYVPHDVFKGVRLNRLRIQDSNLVALSDTDEAFVGQEDHLKELEVKNCTLRKEMDWTVLRNLRKLERIYFRGGDLENIGEEFMKINNSSLEWIDLSRNKISLIYEHAFATFKNVGIIDLDHNEMKELKRSMFPNPALKLYIFGISHNLIEQLPDDMFHNMPKLEILYIGNNKILVLNEKTFSPIWELLEYLDTRNDFLRCDCRMSWILEKKSPRFLHGTCKQPQNLKGRSLKSLTNIELRCDI